MGVQTQGPNTKTPVYRQTERRSLGFSWDHWLCSTLMSSYATPACAKM